MSCGGEIIHLFVLRRLFRRVFVGEFTWPVGFRLHWHVVLLLTGRIRHVDAVVALEKRVDRLFLVGFELFDFVRGILVLLFLFFAFDGLLVVVVVHVVVHAEIAVVVVAAVRLCRRRRFQRLHEPVRVLLGLIDDEVEMQIQLMLAQFFDARRLFEFGHLVHVLPEAHHLLADEQRLSTQAFDFVALLLTLRLVLLSEVPQNGQRDFLGHHLFPTLLVSEVLRQPTHLVEQIIPVCLALLRLDGFD